ncbi:hypothetical protein NUU61_005009 [Penicillium alfredii]|uniref:BZIP domain-containing protein n=1 Tax=Penicillium alfredii TaxID=1506179 RepID=A0A9W9K763_9EURO|nr:uncharacterized protein NUU61_005009 [Penicillium alfredii]KAJ5095653.1 hypothetical protein NUU61_005009 [Penicillium alfredii]
MDYSYYNAPQSQPFSLYGLPTPDQQSQAQADALPDSFPLNNYDQNFPAFDPSFRLNPSSSLVPPPHSPPDSYTKRSASSSEAAHNLSTDPTSLDGDGTQIADPGVGRSSSEEKDSGTPSHTKRKAQNRAAQRAFRERKERHMRDLEDKVANLETQSSTLQADNERLKRELARYATENEVLRATSQTLNQNNKNGSAPERTEPAITGPMEYSPTDFTSKLAPEGSNASASPHHRVTVCQVTGEKLLDSGATWDLIQGHDLFKQGRVDIGDVTERLKGMAQCNGQGPAFKENQVRQAIEASAAAGRDELI